MRIAIVSDIHGNRTAFEAVLADLRQTSPDLILHGGDLADGGSSPAEIVDRIRDLGWPGVFGNTDEMLSMPESLKEFANQSPKLQPLFGAIQEMATATCEALGGREARMAARPAAHSDAWSDGARARQSPESLARTHAGSERRRVEGGLRTARPTDCHLWAHPLWAHPSILHSEHFRNDRRQHRQR